MIALTLANKDGRAMPLFEYLARDWPGCRLEPAFEQCSQTPLRQPATPAGWSGAQHATGCLDSGRSKNVAMPRQNATKIRNTAFEVLDLLPRQFGVIGLQVRLGFGCHRLARVA